MDAVKTVKTVMAAVTLIVCLTSITLVGKAMAGESIKAPDAVTKLLKMFDTEKVRAQAEKAQEAAVEDPTAQDGDAVSVGTGAQEPVHHFQNPDPSMTHGFRNYSTKEGLCTSGISAE